MKLEQRQNNKLKRQIDIAWAAGLFEGEGCISVGFVQKDKYHRIECTLDMIDEDIVKRFHNIIGLGNVTFRPARDKNKKPIWSWKLYRRNDAQDFIKEIFPYLGKRRTKKALEALSIPRIKEHKSNKGWRKTHCHNGHEKTTDNIYTNKNGYKRCKICTRELNKKWRENNPEKYRESNKLYMRKRRKLKTQKIL